MAKLIKCLNLYTKHLKLYTLDYLIKMCFLMSLLMLFWGAVNAIVIGTVRSWPVNIGIDIYHHFLGSHSINTLIFWPTMFQIGLLLYLLQRINLDSKHNIIILAISLLILVIGSLWMNASVFISNESMLASKFHVTKLSKSFMFGFKLFSLGQTGALFWILLHLMQAQQKIKKSEFWWFNSAMALTITMLLCAIPNFILNTIGSWTLEQLRTNSFFQDYFWLCQGHLNIQSMAIATFIIWSFLFHPFIKSNPIEDKLRNIAIWLYPLFVGMAVIQILPFLLFEYETFIWKKVFVLIPAVAHLFFFATSLLRFEQSKKLGAWKCFPSSSIFAWILAMFSFSVIGLITGLALYKSDYFFNFSLGSLLIPGHFHPLVAGGISLSFLGFLYLYWHEQGFKMEKDLSVIQVILFILGILTLSFSMDTGGTIRMLRRYPVQGSNPGVSMMISLGSFIAFSSLIIAIFLFFKSCFTALFHKKNQSKISFAFALSPSKANEKKSKTLKATYQQPQPQPQPQLQLQRRSSSTNKYYNQQWWNAPWAWGIIIAYCLATATFLNYWKF